MAVTGLDLSPWYLKKARESMEPYRHCSFVEANAEAMPFRDGQFDVVSCIFLFHELPRPVRQKITQEMARVLRPGGQLIFVDSIQLGDKPQFDGSLKAFPTNYHEPYYLDFVEEDLDPMFTSAGLSRKSQDLAYFSKILSYEKVESTEAQPRTEASADSTAKVSVKSKKPRKKKSQKPVEH
jgi:ubiquinone/menaquinone biosynthesis C-methylase UbiE